jgi:ribose transport system ATP-binding protein
MTPTNAPILDMRGIDKSFPGAHALRAVDLTVARGEVMGLVGENGAGKSTLVKILSGAYRRDAGEIRIAGEVVEPESPRHMIEFGVAVIYQEPSLAPHLTAAENIFMGRLPTTRIGLVDWNRVGRDTLAVSEHLGLELKPRARVGRLSVADRQMIEIAKALSRNARLIVLDEPSAVLGEAELRGLFEVIRRLAATGVAFIYISHRLNEVFRVTDRVTVMKDGQVVATEPTQELTTDRLVRLMVGRDLSELYPDKRAELGCVALSLRGVTRRGAIADVDLTVREGEILGVAGLVGSGRTELLRAVEGADPIDAGDVEVFGRPVTITSPSDAIELGVGLLTEDRKADGLMLKQSVAFNVTIAHLREIVRRGLLRPARERKTVEEYRRRLAVRASGPNALISQLSGGNQQKCILARWLHANCRILLIDEPTRGVDVGAKREIYELLTHLAERGVAIVMVSSDLPEVLGLSDRIIVMREGRVTAELVRAEATEELIMHHATRQVGSAAGGAAT